MNRITKALADTTAKLMFRTAEVTAVAEHGARFRAIELTGDGLEKATWSAGDKIQVRTSAEGFTTRTYTPITWDSARGSMRLLAYTHGSGPGSTWAQTLTIGSVCQLFGPRSSLKLEDLDAPIIFVGDETTFALVAAWCGQHPDAEPVATLFEINEPDESAVALDAVGVSPTQLFRRDDSETHVEPLVATAVDLLRSNKEACLCLTGKAQTIAAVRRRVKAERLADRTMRVKAYWNENRSGLD